MCSILDIDLDYFNLTEDPIGALEDLLRWGDVLLISSSNGTATRFEDGRGNFMSDVSLPRRTYCTWTSTTT